MTTLTATEGISTITTEFPKWQLLVRRVGLRGRSLIYPREAIEKPTSQETRNFCKNRVSEIPLWRSPSLMLKLNRTRIKLKGDE